MTEQQDNNIKGITVPHNSDIEAGILGAILRDNGQFDFMVRITPEMFYVPGHRKLWEIIKNQIDKGNPASPTTLKHLVDQTPEISGLGGSEYLSKLTFEEYSIISPKRYVEILVDLYHKREIVTICQESVVEAMDSELDETAHEICNRTETRLFNLESTHSGSRTFSLAEASNIALEEIALIKDGKADAGVPTGFTSLQNVMGGLRRSDLLILAARPAMGKTSLAMNMAFNAARYFHKNKSNPMNNKSVLFFTLEMSAQQLSTRILSDQAGIPLEKLRLGNLNQKEFNQYVATSKTIAEYPLFIEENPNVNVGEMRAIIRKIARKKPVGMIVLDYLQLLSGSGKRKNENRVQEVSEITRGLKLLAREFDVPILALSQLSRQVENRDNKTPNLSDLRESGSIEQDADMVMFLYRPEYYQKAPEIKDTESDDAFNKRQEQYEENVEKLKGIAKVIIAKNRHGAPTTVDMRFHKELIRFTDMETRYKNNSGIPNEA